MSELLTPDQIVEAIRRYKDGFSLCEIAMRFGYRESHVHKTLKKLVKLRSSGGAHKSPMITRAVIAKAREMFPDKNIGAIALELDVPRTALRRALGIRNCDYTGRVASEIHQICEAMRQETKREMALYDHKRNLRLQEDGRL